MPNLTGLPALLKRAQVLASAAISWLTAISAALVVLAQQLNEIGGVPEWATRALASVIAVLATITLQVRRVTPVAPQDKGLLPPKGPAAEADPNRDVGDISLLEVIVIVIAVGLFILALKVY